MSRCKEEFNLPEQFSQHRLPNGIMLNFLPTAKFKTISLSLFLHQELSSRLAALNALLPSVLEQGSRRFPDYLTLQRELENLYGADLSVDVLKSGERHIIAFNLETAHGRYLGENGLLLKRGLSILGAVACEPLIVDGSFREDYVRQEKNQLVKEIRALLNDKGSYALERCKALMCAEERFGVYRLGRVEEVEAVDPRGLYSYYREILAANPLDLYVVGDLEEEPLLEAAAETFGFSRNGDAVIPPTEIGPTIGGARFFEEKMSVNQAKLVLGFRTATGFRDPLHFALLVYSGVLGGFPHSKLFMNVREKAGLAYYIHTRLERHKGLMFVAAGIDAGDYGKARSIIEEQLEDTAAGRVSDIELENTRRGLVNQLLTRQDSPGQLISFHLDGSVGGRPYTVAELVAGIEAVSREDIKAVAERVRLDTVYLLRPREGEE